MGTTGLQTGSALLRLLLQRWRRAFRNCVSMFIILKASSRPHKFGGRLLELGMGTENETSDPACFGHARPWKDSGIQCLWHRYKILWNRPSSSKPQTTESPGKQHRPESRRQSRWEPPEGCRAGVPTETNGYIKSPTFTKRNQLRIYRFYRVLA